MALSILIADPDQKESSNIKLFLENNLYTASTSSNGKDVQLKLYHENFYALIINWQIENHSASQVLVLAKKTYPKLKVIVIVNEQELLESEENSEKEILKLGAHFVITKPYELDQILEILDGQNSTRVLRTEPLRDGVSPEIEVQGNDQDYTPIPIAEFFSSKAVLFDVFIKLSKDKYIKILHTGDTFSAERITKYKEEKNVEFLYFHKKDRMKFIHFNNLLLNKVIPNDKIGMNTKINIIQNLSSKYIDEVHLEGLKPQIVEQGREICESIFQFVKTERSLFKLLKDLEDFDPTTIQHSALVTLYVTAITKQFDWQSAQTIQSMALACLFHDIGKTKFPKELLEISVEDMNEEQFTLYKQHPQFGFEILDQNKMINNTVKQVILQHHETYDGQGYPNGIKGSKILLMANIVCLVDDFIDLMINEKKNPVETLRMILKDKIRQAKYHSSIMENFIKVFIDPEKMPKEPKNMTMTKKAS